MFNVFLAATVTLSWTASPEPITGYEIHWGAEPGNYTASKNLPASETSFTIETDDDNQSTYFAVRAVAGGKASTYSNEVVDAKKPVAPTLRILVAD